jgi:hypothetical protein
MILETHSVTYSHSYVVILKLFYLQASARAYIHYFEKLSSQTRPQTKKRCVSARVSHVTSLIKTKLETHTCVSLFTHQREMCSFQRVSDDELGKGKK